LYICESTAMFITF